MAGRVALTTGKRGKKEDALPTEKISKIKGIFLDFRFRGNPSTGDSRFIYASTSASFISAIAKSVGANTPRGGICRARERTMDLVLGSVPKVYRRAADNRDTTGWEPRPCRLAA